MRRAWRAVVEGALVAVASARGLYRSWPLAAFSLVAAFGIWVVIEDVENPRSEGVVPGEESPGVRIEAVNVADEFIVSELGRVRVRVEARKDDLPEMDGADFRATVDLEGVQPGERVTRPVVVEARRQGVEIRAVLPSSVEVGVLVAESRDVPVRIRKSGELPANLSIAEEVAEPAIVTVRGLGQLVASVRTVDLDVNLGALREGAATVEGDLVARTESGNPIAVTLSQRRGRASFKVEQLFVQRTLPLVPAVVGTPALGYLVAGVALDPPTVVVSGPRGVVDGLRSLTVERVDVTGAARNIAQTRQIERPPNVAVDRQAVVVRVELRPIECGGSATGAPCGAASFVVAPGFESGGSGLGVEGGPYTVVVRVSGPVTALVQMRPVDVRATVSLVGLTPGVQTVNAIVALAATAPAGVRVESAEPVTIRVVPAVGP